MTNTTNQNNRELWLTNGANMIIASIIKPALVALDEQAKLETLQYVVSIGHPKTKGAIGECWRKEASQDNATSHIFLTPACNDSTRVLDVLLHELIHALDDCASGHKNFFAKMARKCGLDGLFTATVASPQLQDILLDIVDVLGGDIPHHALIEGAQNKPKQKSRMIKIECEHCDFSFRTSLTNVKKIKYGAPCPCCTNNSAFYDSIKEAVAE